MFLKSCWKADKNQLSADVYVPGLSDLEAVYDGTLFHCLTVWKALIIMQAAADHGDVMSADGNENETEHYFLKSRWNEKSIFNPYASYPQS